jgi:hypothetical protein
MYIGQAEEPKVGPSVPRPGQIPEEHNNFCSSAKPRNIMTYVPRPGQEAEKHKVGPYVPRLSRGT